MPGDPLLIQVSCNLALVVWDAAVPVGGKVLQTDFILLGILKRREVEAVELQELPLDP